MGSAVSRPNEADTRRAYLIPKLTGAGQDALSHSIIQQKTLINDPIVRGDHFHNNRQPDYILANLPFTVGDWRRELLGEDKHCQDSVPAAGNASHLPCADTGTKVPPIHA